MFKVTFMLSLTQVDYVTKFVIQICHLFGKFALVASIYFWVMLRTQMSWHKCIQNCLILIWAIFDALEVHTHQSLNVLNTFVFKAFALFVSSTKITLINHKSCSHNHTKSVAKPFLDYGKVLFRPWVKIDVVCFIWYKFQDKKCDKVQ